MVTIYIYYLANFYNLTNHVHDNLKLLNNCFWNWILILIQLPEPKERTLPIFSELTTLGFLEYRVKKFY